MADEYTTNLNLIKPDVGGSDDTWGEKLNDNLDIIDAAIAAAGGLPPSEYITETELAVTLDAYITDAELAATIESLPNPPEPATEVPIIEGVGAVGISLKYAREDHVHPTGGGGGGGDASVLVSDTPPVGAPDNSLWWESDTGQLYINYNDGTSTQWVLAVPQTSAASIGAATTEYVDAADDALAAADAALTTAVNNRVRYDAAQTLTETQKVQARTNIYAAPFDALAYSGMQINGAMDVSQENGSNVYTAPFGYVVDGWSTGRIGTMATQSFQQAVTWLAHVNNSVVTAVLTAQTTMGAGDVAFIGTRIEGYRMARLRWGTAQAQPITLAFTHAHFPAGTYTGTIRNEATNRVYAFTYTQSVTGESEYSVVTIPGDTLGTWNITNGVGLDIQFCMAAGADFIAPAANVWGVGAYLAAPGQVNGVASTANQLRLANLIVLPGIEAPSAERSPLIMRPYDQELVTCQRYYEKQLGRPLGYGGNIISGSAYIAVATFSAQKRATPTMGFTFAIGAGFPATVPAGVNPGLSYIEIEHIANVTQGYGYYFFEYTADARL